MSKNNFLCGIVTYNPNIDRLCENIYAISKQISNIIIYDNGSDNINEIEKITKDMKYRLIKNDVNNGIASALKYIMDVAIRENNDWVLLLDQDSVVQSGLIAHYTSFICNKNVGMMTCNIIDRNFNEHDKQIDDSNYNYIEKCITSGSFTRVEAYKKTSGYDKYLFIDKVDFDICYSIQKEGYQIIQVNYNGLLHEIGHGRNVNFFGNRVIYNHPAWRVYYMARNSIYLAKKYSDLNLSLNLIKSEIGRIILIIFFEENKHEKILAFLRGIRDGFLNINFNT